MEKETSSEEKLITEEEIECTHLIVHEIIDEIVLLKRLNILVCFVLCVIVLLSSINIEKNATILEKQRTTNEILTSPNTLYILDYNNDTIFINTKLK